MGLYHLTEVPLMVNEWHGIPFVRRWRRQEMGKVGIVLPRYELHLTFKWWRTARVFLQRWVKSLSVLQSLLKPLFCFFRASVAWLEAPTHSSVICCFQFAISLLSGNTTLKKKKAMPHNNWFSPWKADKTITGLESTLSSSDLQVQVHLV